MALKFLNKKGWHTGSLRNLENVWKAEQKHEAEQKKLEELKVQIHKEREAEELRQQYQAAGLAPKQDRLEFLYDSGAGPSNKPADDYKTQKVSVESKSDAKPGEKLAGQTPGALFSSENNNMSANDKWRKIHSDPLYLIKQQELAALERIRKNPVKMEMLANQVRQKMKAEKDKYDDGDGKHRKKRKKDKSGERHVRDHKHEKKGEKELKEKKKSKSDKHQERRHPYDSSDSESSDSQIEARPSKKVETDDRLGRTSDRDYGYAEKFDRESGPPKVSDMNDRGSRRSYRDGSPRHEAEDQRERVGNMNQRTVRDAVVGDRYRDNHGRSGRSGHHDMGDRPTRKYENESRSSSHYSRSSKDFDGGDRIRESPDKDARHPRYSGSAIRSRNHERDDRSPKEYERDRRRRKSYEREDSNRRTPQ